MRLQFKRASANKESINYEIDFTFLCTQIDPGEIPIGFEAVLLAEDKVKLADLIERQPQDLDLRLNAGNATRSKVSSDFTVLFRAQLSDKAINHIEKKRLESNKKEVVFHILITYKYLVSETYISHIHLGAAFGPTGQYKYEVFYQQNKEYGGGGAADLWLLSADNSSHFLSYKTLLRSEIVKIPLMEWIGDFAPKLNVGNFVVYELLAVDEQIINKGISKRYEKAQRALIEIKRQLEYGEWKAAIKACRPIVELFKNFDDFKKYLLDHGYSTQAYENLRDSIQHFFYYLSKFDHALTVDKNEVNPEITPYREDAYMAYTFCISLLNLISQKERR